MKENLRQHRCCFTGHRPNKLRQSEQEIKPLLEKAIDWAIDNGFVTFISGMAEGVDIWAAEIILDKRKSNADLHLICALPHPGFENRRSISEKAQFQKNHCSRRLRKACKRPLFYRLLSGAKRIYGGSLKPCYSCL